MHPTSDTPAPVGRIVFAGTPEFAAVALQALLDAHQPVIAVYTQPDRPAGRGRKAKASPVKTLALSHGLPVYQPATLRRAEAQRELAGLAPDLMVVAAYGLILPQAVLGIPPRGCLNIHASLLPRWRGAAPIQRAILAGDTESGISIMQMEAGLDTGPVLLRRATPIGHEDTAQTLHDRLAALGAEALLEALAALRAGTVHAEPQDEALATYAAKLDKREAVLDWQDDAAALERRVRAFNPWPVACTQVGERDLRIWRACALPGAAESPPGTVLAVGKDGIDVACGAGRLRLQALQLAGGRAMSAAALQNGYPGLLTPGVRLGR